MLTMTEKKLLDAAQGSFPVCARPYRTLGERFGITEEDVMTLLQRQQKKGLVRYVGPIFDMSRMGVVSTLVGMRVSRRRMRAVARIINSYPEVTHNYERDGEYNLWFTLSASSRMKLGRILKEICQKTAIKDVVDARTLKVFKRRAVFAL